MICNTVVVDKWAFTRRAQMQRQELGTAATVVLALYFLLIVAAVVLVLVAGTGVSRGFH